jgi:hypothetical protein
MELAMKQMLYQMTKLSFHLLEPKVSKYKNLKRDLSTIQCYKCHENVTRMFKLANYA